MGLLSCASTKARVAAHDDFAHVESGGIYTWSEAAKASEKDMRSKIAASDGLDPSLRMSLWPPLLELSPWPSPPFEGRTPFPSSLSAEYSSLISQADTVPAALKSTILADVPRTPDLNVKQREALHDLLIAHCVLEPQWGYFQGMNDIARIVLAVYDASHLLECGGAAQSSRVGATSPRERDLAPALLQSSDSKPSPPPPPRGGTDSCVAPAESFPPSTPATVMSRASDAAEHGSTVAALTPASASGAVFEQGQIFWLLRGVLAHCSDNWAHEDLEGVWRQARAVRAVLLVSAPKLMRRLDSMERHGSRNGPAERSSNARRRSRGGAAAAADDEPHEVAQPLAFLFGAIFLRLKREMTEHDEAMRLWEVCWANERNFHVLVLAAFVSAQAEKIGAVPPGASAIGRIHQMFGALHGTQQAAPLLARARELQRQPGVWRALEGVMAATAKTA